MCHSGLLFLPGSTLPLVSKTVSTRHVDNFKPARVEGISGHSMCSIRHSVYCCCACPMQTLRETRRQCQYDLFSKNYLIYIAMCSFSPCFRLYSLQDPHGFMHMGISSCSVLKPFNESKLCMCLICNITLCCTWCD